MLSKPVLFLYNLHFKVYITPRRGQHAQVFMQTQLPWTFSFGHAICHPEYSFRLSFFLFYSFPSFVLSFVIGSLIIHVLWSCARHFPMHFLIGHAITYAFVHDSCTESCIFSVSAVNFVSDFFLSFILQYWRQMKNKKREIYENTFLRIMAITMIKIVMILIRVIMMIKV